MLTDQLDRATTRRTTRTTVRRADNRVVIEIVCATTDYARLALALLAEMALEPDDIRLKLPNVTVHLEHDA